MAVDRNQQAYPVRSVIVGEDGGAPEFKLSGSSAVEDSHQSLTVSSSAVALPSIPEDAAGALITVEDQPIRATWDGTTPTSSVGHKYIDGDAFAIASRADLLRFRAIRSSSSDATLQITYV